MADAAFREHKAYTVFLSDLVDDDSTEDKRVSLKTIPFGLIGKEYAKTTEAGCRNSQLKAWASHFFPVLYVITSCENTHAYETGYRIMAGLKIANTDDAPVMGPRVRQVHGDFAREIEVARRRVFKSSVRAADFRHMIAKVEVNLLGKLLPASHADNDSHYKQILRALHQTRTACSTLCEFHTFWYLFFKIMKEEWEEVAAEEYLRATYFFKLSAADAQTMHEAHSCIDEQAGILCAPWWASYHRLQPGSASGTQCIETAHGHAFRGAFVGALGGECLHHLSPDVFLDALDNAVVYQSRQAALCTATISDIPTGGCPTSRNSTELRKVGRSTSVELVASPSLMKRVSFGNNEEVYVLPRSFFMRDRQRRAPPGVQLWKDVPLSALKTSEEDAKAIARCACEHNGLTLMQWWKDLGILTGLIGSSAQFHLKIWSRHRFHRCVVIGKPFADRVWMCKNAPPLLCSCLPFGLHGRCEHEQACLHFLRTGPETNLNVPRVAACNHRPSKYPQQAAAGMAASAIILQKWSSNMWCVRRPSCCGWAHQSTQ